MSKDTEETMLAVIDYHEAQGTWGVALHSNLTGNVEQTTGIKTRAMAEALQAEYMKEHQCEGVRTAAASTQDTRDAYDQIAPVEAAEPCRGECQEHQGHRNYPSWSVSLWIDTSEGLQIYWLSMAQEQWDETEGEDDRAAVAKQALADMLKHEYEERAEEQIEGNNAMSDILTWAVGIVDWRGIAEALLEDIANA